MPLTAKGEKILKEMKEEYGEDRGEEVFYASKNAGKITGVDSAHDSISAEYERARQKSNAAQREYDEILRRWRARDKTLSDKDFFAAQEKYKKSQAEFDRAYSQEEERQVREEEKAAQRKVKQPSTQGDLFRKDVTVAERIDTMTQQVNSLGKAAAAMVERIK